MLNITILGSTRGSCLPDLYHSLAATNLTVVEVISNKPDAGILVKARQLGITTICIPSTTPDFEQLLGSHLEQTNTELLVLLGFMKIFSKQFVAQWRQRIINVHPSLLPKHAGLMDLSVHQAVLDNNETVTGCTVHWVTEEVDAGVAIIQKTCPVLPDDSAETLKTRVQTLEVAAITAAIKQIITGERRVREVST